jgi:asparagine synthase (glutamine-hydrolysing)
MGFVPGARCLLQGVNKLPPAHALLFNLDSGQSKLWRYWHPPDRDPSNESARAGEAELLDELESLLEDAVRRQLVADVPVGVLLSGGVDSSLITAMAVRAAPRVKTFTIRFPGHGQHDETEHARLIARHFSTEHVELEAGESTIDLMPLLVRQFDEPIVDSSMIPTYLVSRMVRRHCTVALGGDGGDELFGGYIHYNRLLWIQKMLSWVPRPLRTISARAADRMLPAGFKGRKWLQGLGVDLRRELPLISACSFDRGMRAALMTTTGQWPLVAETIHGQNTASEADLLQRATRTDFGNYLPDGILVKVDRASMLNSLEVRAPLLDHRILEFAFGKVPSRLKATPSARKVLLKKLTARLLPPEFDQHRKQGFTIPLGSWLQSGPWSAFFREVLLGSQNTFFCKKTVGRLLDDQARGLSNSERLFALVAFELWRREYRVSM